LSHRLKSFIIFFLILSLSGCAKSGTPDTTTLTVWHWMSDREDAFETLARQYEKSRGIKVRFELYAPSEAYAQRVKAAAQTSRLPDIYGVLGEKRDFASFINSGFVTDLTAALNAKDQNPSWKDSFFEKALAVNEFLPGNEYGVAPGIYGIPLDVTTIQMIYNKKLFREAGLDPNDPPETWEAFISSCRALRERGISCLVSGFGEIWLIEALASNLAMNLMGEEKVFKTYRGEVPYTDPDWIKTLSLFKQITDEKILVDGAVTMVNKTAEQTFANERAALAFNGSWCVNVYKGMNPSLEYAPMRVPKVSSLHPVRIWGGAGTSFVVNAQSPRREAAVQFLKWLTAEDQQVFLSTQTENLPSNKNSLKNIPEVLSQFADDTEFTTHPNLYPVRENPVVTEALDKGIQSILIGEKSVQEVAQEVQRVKEKESKKRKA
jgi:ABC-type glycerol-3-phosphate transport system substrate-binding protein